MPLNTKELTRIERSILENKQEVSRILADRSRATLSKDDMAALRAWTDASEKTLDGCNAISRYVEHFSKPIARQLEASLRETSKGLEDVKKSGDPVQFHRWMKTQFVPHVRESERMAHLAASSVYKAQGRDVDLHRWTGNQKQSSRPGSGGRQT